MVWTWQHFNLNEHLFYNRVSKQDYKSDQTFNANFQYVIVFDTLFCEWAFLFRTKKVLRFTQP